MEINFSTGNVKVIKSKKAIHAFLSLFILVGIILVVVFSTGKLPTVNDYYVNGTVESCEVEVIIPGGARVVQKIAYSVENKDYVWEYVSYDQKFFEGETVKLKVDRNDHDNVQLDLDSKFEKNITRYLPIIVGVVFIVAGVFGILVSLKKNANITVNTGFGL